jgi:hypothetical protein
VTKVDSQADLEDGTKCDHPILLGMGGGNAPDGRSTQCVPHSRLGVLHSKDAVGNATDFAYICRAYYFRKPDAHGHQRFDDLGLIGHNPATGATCFWSIPINGVAPGSASEGTADDISYEGSTIPKPGKNSTFWKSTADQAASHCQGCHDNDPFIASPVVRMTGILPSHPLGPYWMVHGARWNQRIGEQSWNARKKLVSPEAHACTTCHRISDGETCGSFFKEAAGLENDDSTDAAYATAFPFNTWMDNIDPEMLRARYPTRADWMQHFGGAVKALTACCADPSAPGCSWEKVTADVCCKKADGTFAKMGPDACFAANGNVTTDGLGCR